MSTQPIDTSCTYCGTPLVDMPCGCKLRVSDLSGTPSSRSRLYALGILPGVEMEVCRPGDGAGSVCVRVRQSSLVLGESLARLIFCRAVDENDLHDHCHSRRKHGQEYGKAMRGRHGRLPARDVCGAESGCCGKK